MKERDCTFDIMKGIAMVLVILSHTLPFEMTRPFAPFRSTLFFVVSGYFAKDWLFKDFVIHGSKRLLIPYLFTCFLMLPLVLQGECLFDYQALLTALKSMALGSSSFEGELFDVNIGPLWFICALLWVRIFWSLMRQLNNDYVKGAVILLVAISALKLKNYFILPWSLQPALGALGFFFAGHIFRKYEVLSKLKGEIIPVVCLGSLFYGVLHGFTDINRGVYGGWYIIDVFALPDIGDKLIVVCDGSNILLKPVLKPSMSEFRSLIEETDKITDELATTPEMLNAFVKENR